VPIPGNTYGAKGVAEVNICPSMAAIANTSERAVGRRLLSNFLPGTLRSGEAIVRGITRTDLHQAVSATSGSNLHQARQSISRERI
jgi:hypothetical protein